MGLLFEWVVGVCRLCLVVVLDKFIWGCCFSRLWGFVSYDKGLFLIGF